MAEIRLNEGTALYEVRVAYDDNGNERYYFRTVEASSPEEAEYLVTGDFYSGGIIEEVVSVNEKPVSDVEKQLDFIQEDLIIRSQHYMGLYNSIMMKNMNGIRKFIEIHSSDPVISGYIGYRDIIDHLDADEMSEKIKNGDTLFSYSLSFHER